MARTAITVQSFNELNIDAGAGTLDYTYSASDNVNGNSVAWPATGQLMLLVQNADASPQTITITTVDDKWGRGGALTAYSMAAGDFVIIPPMNSGVFKQSTNVLYVDTSDADVKIAAIRIP